MKHKTMWSFACAFIFGISGVNAELSPRSSMDAQRYFGLSENPTQEELNSAYAQLMQDREKGLFFENTGVSDRDIRKSFEMISSELGNNPEQQLRETESIKENLGNMRRRSIEIKELFDIEGPVTQESLDAAYEKMVRDMQRGIYLDRTQDPRKLKQLYEEYRKELEPGAGSQVSSRTMQVRDAFDIKGPVTQESLNAAYAQMLRDMERGIYIEKAQDPRKLKQLYEEFTKELGNAPLDELAQVRQLREGTELERETGKIFNISGPITQDALNQAYAQMLRDMERGIYVDAAQDPRKIRDYFDKMTRQLGNDPDEQVQFVQEAKGERKGYEYQQRASELFDLSEGYSQEELNQAYGRILSEVQRGIFQKDGQIIDPAELQNLYEALTRRLGNDPQKEFMHVDLVKAEADRVYASTRRDAELNRLFGEMKNQAASAFQIDLNELQNINFANIFINKLLSLIPQKEVAVLRNLVIKTPTFFETQELHKDQYGFGIKGSIIYEGAETQITVLIVRGVEVDGEIDKSKWGISVGITMPQRWNFSSNYPFLAQLDELSFFSPRLVFSNFDYYSDELGSIKKGLNIVAYVNLVGPLAKFQSLVQNNHKYLVAQGGKMRLNGVIGTSLAASSFQVTIPLYLGVDFNELYKMGKIKNPPSLISRITTDDIVVQIKGSSQTAEFFNLSAELSARAGIIISLVTQPDPISFNAGVGFTPPTAWRFFGEMKGMWDPAFGQEWLALGNTAIEVITDSTVSAQLAAFGIITPITGLGMQGTFAFGRPGDSRVTTSIAGKLTLTAQAGKPVMPTFILDGKLNRASLSDAIMLLARMVGKPINPGSLPNIEFNDLQLRIVPKSGMIGTTQYEQGARVSAGMKIGNFAGGISFAISNESKSIEGSGYITSFSNPVFRLTGFQEPNPQFKINISPFSADIKIDGNFEIPALGYRRALSFSLDSEGLFKRSEKEKMFNTEMKTVEIRIPFNSFDGLLYRYELESNTMQAIKDSIRAELSSWKTGILAAAERGRQNLRDKLERKQREIEDLKRRRQHLEETCKEKTKDFRKILTKDYWSGVKDCINVAVKAIDEQATKLDKELSDMTLKVSETLRPENVPAVLFDAVSQMVDVATAIQITRVFGEVTGADLRQGKLPRFSLEMTINALGQRRVYTLRNVQFDFKNPKGSGKAIAEAIKQFFTPRID